MIGYIWAKFIMVHMNIPFSDIRRKIYRTIGLILKMVFLKFVIILGLIMVGQIAARGVIRFLDEYVRSGMENVIKTRLYETILSRKYSAITAFHKGELLNRITNDAVVVADGFVQIIPGIIAMLVKLVGAGKSTLLKLLLAIYEPEKGTLELKTDKESYALTERYRKMFAYVPQGNFLMSGNVTSAIASLDDTNADVDMDKVKAVAHIACADTFVEKLEHGYDTLIGERGMGISEGQAQRLAIARALYTDAPVLLLDEATSALDEQIEKKVLKNIRELTDKTVIIVSHRKAVLEVCDRCVVLEDKHFE